MNKNKIIFSVIGAIFLVLILLLVTSLNSEKTPAKTTIQSGDFHIWIVDDSVSDFKNFVAGFKQAYPNYAGKNIVVESFQDRQTYTCLLYTSPSPRD